MLAKLNKKEVKGLLCSTSGLSRSPKNERLWRLICDCFPHYVPFPLVNQACPITEGHESDDDDDDDAIINK